MSDKLYRIVYESELAWQYPPMPYVTWYDASIRKFLQQHGFDLNKPICKVLDYRGWAWTQKK